MVVVPDLSGTPRDRAIDVVAEKIWEIHGPDSTDRESAEMDAADIISALLASPDILRELTGQAPLPLRCPYCAHSVSPQPTHDGAMVRCAGCGTEWDHDGGTTEAFDG